MTQSILIIDDEADIRDILCDIFADEGYSVHKAAHSEQALSTIKNNKIDLIVLDIWLDNSDMDGVQILKYMKSSDFKDIPILMISGHGNVEMAVNAMKMGAFDFIEKPFKIDHILLTAQRALEQKSLKEENTRLKETGGDINLITHDYKSPAMIQLMKDVQEHAESDARVLILGAVGTGKSYIAKLIHETSKRSKNNISTIHCHELDFDALIDLISKDQQSTIILENIDMLSADKQSKLLNLFNKNETQCRFIATSGLTIKEKIEGHTYSSALYDRLSVIKYTVPKLNDREDDIVVLAKDFASIFAREFHIDVPSFPPSLVTKLKRYDWQGNIRQLKIMIEWMMMGYYLDPKRGLSFNNLFSDAQGDNVVSIPQPALGKQFYDLPLKQAREQFEKDYLETMLSQFGGNIAKVADFIDMERTALYRKLKSMNITYSETTKASGS